MARRPPDAELLALHAPEGLGLQDAAFVVMLSSASGAHAAPGNESRAGIAEALAAGVQIEPKPKRSWRARPPAVA